jgi:hypothetical protein
MSTVEAEVVEPRTRKAKKQIKVARSKTGSDITFPSIMVDGLLKSLTVPWDREIFLPPEFEQDPYVLDAEEKGEIAIETASRMPTAPDPLPQDLDSAAKGWLEQLTRGPYTEQLKTHLKDWRNPRFPDRTNRKGRMNELTNRILPLVKYAVQYEKKLQNREEVLKDLMAVADFIEDEGWQYQPG